MGPLARPEKKHFGKRSVIRQSAIAVRRRWAIHKACFQSGQVVVLRFNFTTILILTGCIATGVFWFLSGTGVHPQHFVFTNDAAFVPSTERFSDFSEMLEWEKQMSKYDYVPSWVGGGELPAEPPEFIHFDREDLLIVPLESLDLGCDATARCMGRLAIIHGKRRNEGKAGQQIVVPKGSLVTYISQWTLWGIDCAVVFLLVAAVGVSYLRDRKRKGG